MRYNIKDLKECYYLYSKMYEDYGIVCFNLTGSRLEEYRELNHKIYEKIEAQKEPYIFRKTVEIAIDYKKEELLELLNSWEELSISPYSDSCYNVKDVDWGYKPENSLRLSDHWNFKDGFGREHCKLEKINEYTEKLLLCQYKNGYYHIIKEF